MWKPLVDSKESWKAVNRQEIPGSQRQMGEVITPSAAKAVEAVERGRGPPTTSNTLSNHVLERHRNSSGSRSRSSTTPHHHHHDTDNSIRSIQQDRASFPPHSEPHNHYRTYASHHQKQQQQQQGERDDEKRQTMDLEEGEEEGGENEERRKRSRQALSCLQCKTRKIKCDRNVPCSACIKRGNADGCYWKEAKIIPNPQPFTRVEETRGLEKRVLYLERFIQALAPQLHDAALLAMGSNGNGAERHRHQQALLSTSAEDGHQHLSTTSSPQQSIQDPLASSDSAISRAPPLYRYKNEHQDQSVTHESDRPPIESNSFPDSRHYRQPHRNGSGERSHFSSSGVSPMTASHEPTRTTTARTATTAATESPPTSPVYEIDSETEDAADNLEAMAFSGISNFTVGIGNAPWRKHAGESKLTRTENEVRVMRTSDEDGKRLHKKTRQEEGSSIAGRKRLHHLLRSPSPRSQVNLDRQQEQPKEQHQHRQQPNALFSDSPSQPMEQQSLKPVPSSSTPTNRLTSALTCIMNSAVTGNENSSGGLQFGNMFTRGDDEARKLTKSTMERVLNLLPSDELLDYLLNDYSSKIGWFYYALYRPSFLAETHYFMNVLKPSERVLVDPLWLAIVCSVLCHTAEGSRSKPLQVVPIHLQREAEQMPESAQWCTLAQDLMAVSNIQCKPQIRSIQVILMITSWIDMSTVSSKDTHNFCLLHVAMACRTAQVLGLHQLGSDDEIMPPDDPAFPPGKNSVKRQGAIRVFSALCFADWINFTAGFRCYLLHQSQSEYSCQPEPEKINAKIFGKVTTQPLYNLNDEDLSATDWRVSPRPRSEHTNVSFQYCKYRLGLQFRSTSDKLATSSKVSYDTVLELDQGYREVLDEMPETWHFGHPASLTMSRKEKWERNVCLIGLNSRIVRLHRPFLTRGMNPNSIYHFSAEQSIRSANIVIKSHYDMLDIMPTGWFLYAHSFCSALVLFIDLFRTIDNDLSEEILEEKQNVLVLASSIFNRFTDIWSPSLQRVVERGARILSGLFAETEKHRFLHRARRYPANGQNLPSPEPFADVLKRISVETNIIDRPRSLPVRPVESSSVPNPSIPTFMPTPDGPITLLNPHTSRDAVSTQASFVDPSNASSYPDFDKNGLAQTSSYSSLPLQSQSNNYFDGGLDFFSIPVSSDGTQQGWPPGFWMANTPADARSSEFPFLNSEIVRASVEYNVANSAAQSASLAENGYDPVATSALYDSLLGIW